MQLTCITLLFFSCSQDVETLQPETNNILELNERAAIAPFGKCSKEKNKSFDDLTYTDCEFTSGDCSNMDWDLRALLIEMMNNQCRPDVGVWNGKPGTETAMIQVSLNNCNYSYSYYNNMLNSLLTKAQSAAPETNGTFFYRADSYEHSGGYMETTYGPYIWIIEVTYRPAYFVE